MTKPTLHLLKMTHGDKPSLSDIIAMFRAIWGREPTPQETEAMRQELDAPMKKTKADRARTR